MFLTPCTREPPTVLGWTVCQDSVGDPSLERLVAARRNESPRATLAFSSEFVSSSKNRTTDKISTGRLIGMGAICKI